MKEGLAVPALNFKRQLPINTMLKQRILTALVMFAVLAGVLWVESVWPFLIFLAITCGVAGWEWTRLTLGLSSRWPIVFGILLCVLTLLQAYLWLIAGLSDTYALQVCVISSVLMSLTAVSTALRRAQVSAPQAPIAWSAFALVTLFATWGVLALLFLEQGVLYVLSLLVIIWIADIAAYFFGRAFGRTKLAPSISPGKTREGALAGIVGVVVWLMISAQWKGTYGDALMAQWGWFGTIALAVLLAIFSIAGDLFESLLKRRAGIKDSSHLLPGHGGVYDRIDAVVAVVPLAYLLTGGWIF